jgi:hypothetical protein
VTDPLDAAAAALAGRLDALLTRIEDDPAHTSPRTAHLADDSTCPVCAYDAATGGKHKVAEPCYRHNAVRYQRRIP